MLYNKEQSYAINGAAMNVYNALGHGFLEAVYQEALELEFIKRGIPYEREKELKIFYEGKELRQTYKADFVCYGDIIVELKAVAHLDDSHRSQVFNYLKATGSNWGCSIISGITTVLNGNEKFANLIKTSVQSVQFVFKKRVFLCNLNLIIQT